MHTFYNVKIRNINKETAHTVSIVFDIPESIRSHFIFKAGQYITLKSHINGEEVKRAYSICSSPRSGEVKVAIKAIEKGTFSVYATEQLKEGDCIEIHQPEGKFILEPEGGRHYIAFAAGSGITPVLSMIKTVLEDTPDAHFTLIYGNRSKADTIFKSELEVLQKDYSHRFNLHYIFSRERVSGSLFGRIDEGFANYYLRNIYKDVSFDSAYLCGPEGMIKTVSNTLQDNGIDESKIFFELFTSSDEGDASGVRDGETAITILVDDEEVSFTMSQTDTILAAALRNNIDAPYSCQGGVCSSCVAKVTKGSAVMTKNSILTDGEVHDGFVLTCQAYPTSSKIDVDFDDV
ncbi:MAG: ferredoxin--NADP reductase [Flavobacteriales bacterium]|nr:ferredoxin--NADP reductase [Flavobacteriales bacterium]